jgi:hypothetical protein
MTSEGEALEVSWDALPAEALERVVAFVTDDVLALCAAACVARAWRDAAERVLPKSAVRLDKLPLAVARRLTDAGLAALVRRARGRLVSLDLRGAQLVKDEGLVAALLQPHALTTFRADITCRELTASAVVRALEPRRNLMREVHVAGLKCSSTPASERQALHQVCNRVIGELNALLVGGGLMVHTTLSGNKVCAYEYEPCARLCGSSDVCMDCALTLCGEHQDGCFGPCFGSCGGRFCDQCVHGGPGMCSDCDAERAGNARGWQHRWEDLE